MNDHQDRVDTEHDSQTMSGERQVSATIKNVSSKAADGEFDAQEGTVAVIQDAGHQALPSVATFKRIQTSVNWASSQFKTNKRQAFGKRTHGQLLSANVVKLGPYYARTPGAS